jgi:hypothetical protein
MQSKSLFGSTGLAVLLGVAGCAAQIEITLPDGHVFRGGWIIEKAAPGTKVPDSPRDSTIKTPLKTYPLEGWDLDGDKKPDIARDPNTKEIFVPAKPSNIGPRSGPQQKDREFLFLIGKNHLEGQSVSWDGHEHAETWLAAYGLDGVDPGTWELSSLIVPMSYDAIENMVTIRVNWSTDLAVIMPDHFDIQYSWWSIDSIDPCGIDGLQLIVRGSPEAVGGWMAEMGVLDFWGDVEDASTGDAYSLQAEFDRENSIGLMSINGETLMFNLDQPR